MNEHADLISIYREYNSDETVPAGDSHSYERLVRELFEYRELAERIIEEERLTSEG